jgi:hypothetical protein
VNTLHKGDDDDDDDDNNNNNNKCLRPAIVIGRTRVDYNLNLTEIKLTLKQ